MAEIGSGRHRTKCAGGVVVKRWRGQLGGGPGWWYGVSAEIKPVQAAANTETVETHLLQSQFVTEDTDLATTSFGLRRRVRQ